MVKTFKVYLGTALDPFILPGCGESNGTRTRTNSSRSTCSVGETDYFSIPQSNATSSPIPINSNSNACSSSSGSAGSTSSSYSSGQGHHGFGNSSLSISPKSPPSSSSSSSTSMVSSSPLPATYEMIKYSCVHCQANLARHEDLISKSFQGSQGRAYLFQHVVNVTCSPIVDRVLLTGLHSVCDISCQCCSNVIGWKYERAFESSQKYKEGKFIVELAHLMKENCWEVASSNEDRLHSPISPRNSACFFDWNRLS